MEPRIVADMGGIIYGPYTGRMFADRGETDIERIVARSEAHDSGLCARRLPDAEEVRLRPLNLTLAAPNVNRNQKVAKDAAEWLPDLNRRWFADRVVRVRQKYGLTIDRREAAALDSVLSGCSSVEMIVSATPLPSPAPAAGTAGNALDLWDDNRNGTHHLRRGAQPRNRARPQGPPGVPVHVGRRRGRRGVRVMMRDDCGAG